MQCLTLKKDLDLEWVYGYRAKQCRNNVQYIGNGGDEIVYFVAMVGIVLDVREHRQRHYFGHNKEIVCLAQNTIQRVVATGQSGADAYTCVWEPRTMETLSVLRGAHEDGISAMDFDHDGNRLVSIGAESRPEVAIWDWRQGRLLGRAAEDTPILFVKFSSQTNCHFVTCGLRHVKFWNHCGNVLEGQSGSYDQKGVRQTMLCAAHGSSSSGAGRTTYTGNLGGDIYVWKNGSLDSVRKDVHPGGVISICRALDMTYVTGGKDGFIQLWNQEFNPLSRINLSILLEGTKGLAIRSVHSRGGEDRVLVGTSNHKVVEVTNCCGHHPIVTCHVNGHADTELNVLAVHPHRPIFVTGSADCTLRLWNMSDRRLLNKVATGSQIMSSDFNSDGSQLAVALRSGAIVILKASDLSETMTIQEESKNHRIIVKHSPDGIYLAAANDNGQIHIHSAFKDYRVSRRWCITSGLTSVTSIDWSSDSRHILVNVANKTRYVYNVPEGIEISNPNERITWSTWTGILGFEVSGLWSKYENECDTATTDVDFTEEIMVTGSESGNVGLLPFPSFTRGVKQKWHRTHCSPISAVRFSYDKSRVISIGRGDHAIMQWKFVQPHVNDISKVESEGVTSDRDSDSEGAQVDPDVESELLLKYDRTCTKEEIREENRKSVSTIDHRKGRGQRKAPVDGLKLKHVFGYRGFDCRDNVHFTKNAPAVVYHVASVGIVHHLETNHQTHYVHHSDDILCLAMHPHKDYAATSQACSRRPIHVWNCETTTTLSILTTSRQCNIRTLDFSSDGKRIVGIGWGENRCAVVWNWRRGEVIASSWRRGNEIFAVKCDPWQCNQFATVGVNHFRLWTIAGNGLLYKIPEFETGNKRSETMVSLSYVKSHHWCMTGGSSGTVYIWEGQFLIKTMKCYDGPVFTLMSSDQGILTAGKDGSVQLWNEHMDRCTKVMPLGPGKRMVVVRAAHVAPHGDIIIGTSANEITLLEKSGRTVTVVQANCKNKSGSLAVHPNKNQVSTVGDDRILRIWDLNSFQMITHKILSKNDFCVTYSTNGAYMAVGSTDGDILILITETMDTLHEWNHRKISISVLRFSPEDSLLAVGYADEVVDVYHVPKWKWLSACRTSVRRAAAAVPTIHVDWSHDGNLLHVNTAQGDSFVFEASTGIRLNLIAEQVKWTTWTSNAGLDCENIWARRAGDVSATCLSADEKLLAVRDVYGFVRLLDFAIMIKYPKCKWYYGHGPSVADIQWSSDGRTLISSSGTDSAILIWNRTAQLPDRKADFDSDESDSDDMEDGFDCQVAKEMVSVETTKRLRKTSFSNAFHQHPKFSLQSKIKLRNSGESNEVFQGSRLSLDYIIGYNGNGCRCNVHHVNDGSEIVYSASSIGIVMNTMTGNQAFYFGHTDTISCVTVNEHPEHPGIVATGQLSGNPAINVWSTSDTRIRCKTRCRLNAGHDAGIAALDFSTASGTLLVAVGLDPRRTVAVFNWIAGLLLANVQCTGGMTRPMILAVKFRPDDQLRFVTVGQCHVTFWTVVGSELLARKGCVNAGDDCLAGNVATKSMLSVTFGKNDVTYTGAANGNIFVWKSHFLQRLVVNAHTGPIYAMHLSLRDGLITTGSRELFGARLDEAGVKVWDPDMKRCRPFLIRTKEKEILIKSISRSKGKIVIGSSENTIHELTEKTGFVRELHQSHGGEDGVWGLAFHGQRPLVATTGGDRTLRIWDVVNRCIKNCLRLECVGLCVHFSAADNDVLALGQKNGEFLLVNVTTMKIMSRRRDTDSAITDLKIDPAGRYLAVVDEGSRINVYCITQGCRLFRLGYYHGPCSKHGLRVDFTLDGSCLMVNSSRVDSVILSVPDCCLLSNAAGIAFPSSLATVSALPISLTKDPSDEKASSSVAMSTRRDLIVAGNDIGEMKLFQIVHNEIQLESEHRFYLPSHFVSNVGFSHDDRHLITTGGHDCSIFIWKLSYEKLGT